jgi:hypothetical protein
VVARLVTYVGTAAAIPVLRRKLPVRETTLRLPGGPAIPVAAIAISLGLAASASVADLGSAALALIGGLAVYLTRRRAAGPEAARDH